jgi:hypothetical protein
MIELIPNTSVLNSGRHLARWWIGLSLFELLETFVRDRSALRFALRVAPV